MRKLLAINETTQPFKTQRERRHESISECINLIETRLLKFPPEVLLFPDNEYFTARSCLKSPH